MNLNKIIRFKLLQLSSKYEISLIEIQIPKKSKISHIINFNYRLKKEPKTNNICKKFYNKKDLVSWLMCIN